jgi:hypothetical protein
MAALFSDFFKAELNFELFVGSLGGPNGLAGKDFLDSDMCGALPRFRTEEDFVHWSALSLGLVPITHRGQDYVLGTVCYPDEDFLMLSRNQDECRVGLVRSKWRVAVFVPHDKPTSDVPLEVLAAFKIYSNFCKDIWHLNGPVSVDRVITSTPALQPVRPFRKVDAFQTLGDDQGASSVSSSSFSTPISSPVEGDSVVVIGKAGESEAFQGNDPIPLCTRDVNPQAPLEGIVVETTSFSLLGPPSLGLEKPVRDRKKRDSVVSAENHEPTGSWPGQDKPAGTEIRKTSLFSKPVPFPLDNVEKIDGFEKQDEPVSGPSEGFPGSLGVKRNRRVRPSSNGGNPSSFTA